MSSHHIVREKQEPALLVANGAACSEELLGQLLEWSPFVLALDGALPRLLELGIKVDAVLGDFDSIGMEEEALAPYQPLRMILAENQELTDLEKGLQFLVEEGHSAVNIVWATGKRLDHTLANLTNLVKFSDKLTINLLDDHSRVYLLPKNFEKWYPAGTTLSLFPIGKVEGITTENLLYPLRHESLETGVRIGTSNEVATDGWVKISHQNGYLLMMECRD